MHIQHSTELTGQNDSTLYGWMWKHVCECEYSFRGCNLPHYYDLND